jgi:5'-3' exonuclease
MGIPSYFKHILDRYPRLLQPVVAGFKSDVLLVDFNCLIYGCIRGPAAPPPYSAATKDAWEAAALRSIEEYVVHIWRSAGQPAQVLLAVDGVVPFAKMRQQRLRRFKSVWLAAKERELGARTGESWDTNAITPGTEFMERLASALRRLAAARPGWTVSAADEAGEG